MTSAPTPRIDLVGIIVADMARSLAFYRQLGLDIPADADGEGHVEATLPGGLRLAWDTETIISSFDPSFAPMSGSGRITLAFHCGTAAGVDAAFAGLVASGAHGHLEPFDAVWGQRYATVTDPDGNHVDLFAPLDA